MNHSRVSPRAAMRRRDPPGLAALETNSTATAWRREAIIPRGEK